MRKNAINHRYSDDELNFVTSLRKEGYSWGEIAGECNQKFWQGKKIRTKESVRSASNYHKYYSPQKNVCAHELLKANQELQRQLERERAKTEVILNVIKTSIAKLPPVKPPKIPQKSKFDDEEAGLLFSDTQIGQCQNKIDTSGFAEYNFQIFEKRLKKLVVGVKRIYDIHSQAYNITRLNIFGLGDYVEGESIFPGNPFYIDQILVDQIFLGAQKIAEAILALAQIFPRVRAIFVYGNHGRLGKRGEHSLRSNADYILARVVQIMLRDQHNIEIIVSESPLCLVEVQKHLFLLVHGDQVKSYLKLPFYGLDTATRRWMSLVGQRIDYVVLGHHHRNCSFDVAYSEAIINGAFPGGSEYSLRKQYEASEPSQLFFGIHPRKGITWRYKIKLADEKFVLKRKGDGVYTPVTVN